MVATNGLIQRKLVAVGPSPIQLCAADNGNAIVALAGGGTSLTILDGESGDAHARVELGSAPSNGIGRGSLAYVACGDAVQVVDVADARLVGTVPLATGSRPRLPVGAFERERLYSLNTGDGTISEIDCSTNSVLRSLAVGGGPQYAHRFNGLMFVANGDSNDVAIVDESRFEVLQRVPVGRAPERGVFDLARTQLWTNDMQDGTLSVIDLASRSVVATVPVGPEPIRLTPWDSRARNEWGVLCRMSENGPDGAIVFVDGVSHALTESLSLPGRALNWNWGIGGRHAVVYVTLDGESQMAIVDAIHVNVIDTVRLSAAPEPAGLGPGVIVSHSGGVFVACQNAVAFLTPS